MNVIYNDQYKFFFKNQIATMLHIKIDINICLCIKIIIHVMMKSFIFYDIYFYFYYNKITIVVTNNLYF